MALRLSLCAIRRGAVSVFAGTARPQLTPPCNGHAPLTAAVAIFPFKSRVFSSHATSGLRMFHKTVLGLSPPTAVKIGVSATGLALAGILARGGWVSAVGATGKTCAVPFLRVAHCDARDSPPSDPQPMEDAPVEVGAPKSESSNARDLALLFHLLKHEAWLLFLAAATSFAVAVVNIRIPRLMGRLINVLSDIVKTGASGAVVDLAVFRAPAFGLMAMYGVQGLLTFVYITLLAVVGERLAERLRTRLFVSLLHQDVAFFDSHKTGELIDRLTTDVQDFKSAFKQCVSLALRSTTQFLGSIFSLVAISGKLTLALIVTVPTVIGVGSVFGSMLRKISKKSQEQFSKATGVAEEAVGNVRTVRAFAMEDTEVARFVRESARARLLAEILGGGIGLFQGLSNVAINGTMLLVLWYGGTLVAMNEITPGDLMSFLVSTQTIQKSLAQVSVLFGHVVRGMAAVTRVMEYIHYKPSIPLTGGFKLDYGVGEVEFRNVSFKYPTRPNQTVLYDLSLKVPAGKVVALVGSSGSGKSTIAALVERFYDPHSGEITVDGADIKTLDLKWLRGEVIGYINQEPVLFAGSVMDNIRYGRPNATDDEVFEAARLANADGFIRDFPDGHGTIVGERGVTVSGGQRQRIAIARALLKNPRILILDEATSALDAESERMVQEALDRLMLNRTVLVIAHRLSTIRHADIIAVVQKGRVVEIGKHDELMRRKDSLYAELVRKQLGGERVL
eukprot:Opistho-2@7380